MHKDGKWAKQIIDLQDTEGKWGWFHSLSQSYGSPITTEQALRRLERLGYTMEDDCIRKAVSYMDSCLIGNQSIPDRREKLHDWDIFTAMILSTWIRRFTPDNAMANAVAEKWASIITRAFTGGYYDHSRYVTAYRNTWGIAPRGGRFVDFVNFYTVSLLRNQLDPDTEALVFDYVLNKDDGIYYVYDKKLTTLPDRFDSRKASRYLAAMELLSEYSCAKDKLIFVVDWVIENKQENDMWDMGSSVNDKVYFPLSDDWRRKEVRVKDCTERITVLLNSITK